MSTPIRAPIHAPGSLGDSTVEAILKTVLLGRGDCRAGATPVGGNGGAVDDLLRDANDLIGTPSSSDGPTPAQLNVERLVRWKVSGISPYALQENASAYCLSRLVPTLATWHMRARLSVAEA